MSSHVDRRQYLYHVQGTIVIDVLHRVIEYYTIQIRPRPRQIHGKQECQAQHTLLAGAENKSRINVGFDKQAEEMLNIAPYEIADFQEIPMWTKSAVQL